MHRMHSRLNKTVFKCDDELFFVMFYTLRNLLKNQTYLVQTLFVYYKVSKQSFTSAKVHLFTPYEIVYLEFFKKSVKNNFLAKLPRETSHAEFVPAIFFQNCYAKTCAHTSKLQF